MAKKVDSVPLGDGAPVVLRRQEGAKRMQLDVGVLVVASVCLEDAWT
jgi:hypothetical protein